MTRAPEAGTDVMGQTAEHHIDAVELGLSDKRPLEVEQREHRRIGLPGKRSRGELGQLDSGVTRQEMDKGHPGVPVSPSDSSLYRLAHERMSIQGDCINIRARKVGWLDKIPSRDRAAKDRRSPLAESS
jgi:hypothetical protein